MKDQIRRHFIQFDFPLMVAEARSMQYFDINWSAEQCTDKAG